MADSKARAEQINLQVAALSCHPEYFGWREVDVEVGSQGGSCRFGLGCLARCRSQLHTSTSLRLLFLQQDHKCFKTTPIAAQLSGLERSGSCPIESSRIPGAPTYQGGPSLRPVDAFISDHPC